MTKGNRPFIQRFGFNSVRVICFEDQGCQIGIQDHNFEDSDAALVTRMKAVWTPFCLIYATGLYLIEDHSDAFQSSLVRRI